MELLNLIILYWRNNRKKLFTSLVLLESVLGDNRLTYFGRILLIDIVSLCKKNGYFWPTNKYFMKKFG